MVSRPLRFFEVPVERHAFIGSTNDQALLRADQGAPEGLVIVAEVQTSGRGRLGRVWWDAPGSSLPFTLLLRPKIPLPQYPLLSLAMASAVAEAAERLTGAAFDVKWPNDVLHAGRKLCGILAESRASGTGQPVLVIGTGVNVNQEEADFPPELRGRATSLRMATAGAAISVSEVLETILQRYERPLALARAGDTAALWKEATRRLPGPGTFLTVRSGGREIEGVVEGISETGALRLREPGRSEAVLVSVGEIP